MTAAGRANLIKGAVSVALVLALALTAGTLAGLVLALALAVGAFVRHLVRAVRLWDSQVAYGVPCLRCGVVEVHLDGTCVERAA